MCILLQLKENFDMKFLIYSLCYSLERCKPSKLVWAYYKNDSNNNKVSTVYLLMFSTCIETCYNLLAKPGHSEPIPIQKGNEIKHMKCSLPQACSLAGSPMIWSLKELGKFNFCTWSVLPQFLAAVTLLIAPSSFST